VILVETLSTFRAHVVRSVDLYRVLSPFVFGFVSVVEYRRERYMLNEDDCYSFWLLLDADTMQSRWGADCMPHGSTEEAFYTVGGNFRGVPRVPHLPPCVEPEGSLPRGSPLRGAATHNTNRAQDDFKHFLLSSFCGDTGSLVNS
jgi:hypothetical protein